MSKLKPFILAFSVSAFLLSLLVVSVNAQTQQSGDKLYSSAIKKLEIIREGGIKNARRIWDAAIKPHQDAFRAIEAKAQADYKKALSDAEVVYNTRISAANSLTNATAKANAIR